MRYFLVSISNHDNLSPHPNMRTGDQVSHSQMPPFGSVNHCHLRLIVTQNAVSDSLGRQRSNLKIDIDVNGTHFLCKAVVARDTHQFGPALRTKTRKSGWPPLSISTAPYISSFAAPPPRVDAKHSEIGISVSWFVLLSSIASPPVSKCPCARY